MKAQARRQAPCSVDSDHACTTVRPIGRHPWSPAAVPQPHISPSIIIVHMAPTSRHSLLFLPPGRDYSRSSRPVAHRRRPHRPPLQWCNSSDAGSSCQPGPISIPTSRQPSPPSPPSDNFPRHCQIEHIGKHASSCGACACSCSADHQRGLRIPAWSRTRDERRNIRVGVKCEGEGAD